MVAVPHRKETLISEILEILTEERYPQSLQAFQEFLELAETVSSESQKEQKDGLSLKIILIQANMKSEKATKSEAGFVGARIKMLYSIIVGKPITYHNQQKLHTTRANLINKQSREL